MPPQADLAALKSLLTKPLPFSYTYNSHRCPQGLIGNPVRIRSGPAAVTLPFVLDNGEIFLAT